MSQVLGGEHPKGSGPGILTLASGRDTESSQDSPLSLSIQGSIGASLLPPKDLPASLSPLLCVVNRCMLLS